MIGKWIIILSLAFWGCGSDEKEFGSSGSLGRERRIETVNRKPNRLINAASPYLKQHALNPVDWYPWGEEALARAVKDDKPILISIGYSSCHWCHVMAHEVFENEEIAALMNKYFICIKVDREERPDLDKIYMNFVQSVYGSGGWPLNVFLTPELVPFFGGTYFPPEDSFGRPGFKSVLLKIHDYYRENKDVIEKGGEDLAARLSTIYSGSGTMDNTADKMLEEVYSFMDLEHGGFGRNAKFPQVPLLSFLLQHVRSHPEVAATVRLTLDNMANRGLYDHIGGGFHRYCTDPEWWVPHFEKMLYDNALIPSVFLEAYQLWGTARYREVVEETLDFVLREMTHKDGGFFSAWDADSDGKEGTFYVWQPDQIEQILGKNIGKIIREYYDVDHRGNFEGSKSVLVISRTIPELAKKYRISESEIRSIIQSSRKKLFQARKRRIPPGLDNKIITAWNGMMIHTLVAASLILDNPRYLQAAQQAVEFIEKNMERNGRYYRTPLQGANALNGYLSDYAYMVNAYISLFEATGKVRYLAQAQKMSSAAVEYFWDRENKGFFFTSHDHEKLFTRIKEATDGAIPSGNAVFARNLLRLYAITMKDSYRKMAVDLMENLGTIVKDNPIGAASWLAAYHFWWGGNQQLVLVGPRENSEIFRNINRKYLPNKVKVWLNVFPESLAAHKGKKMLNGLPTLYICRNFSCREPLNDLKQIYARLDSFGPSLERRGGPAAIKGEAPLP